MISELTDECKELFLCYKGVHAYTLENQDGTPVSFLLHPLFGPYRFINLLQDDDNCKKYHEENGDDGEGFVSLIRERLVVHIDERISASALERAKAFKIVLPEYFDSELRAACQNYLRFSEAHQRVSNPFSLQAAADQLRTRLNEQFPEDGFGLK